jgi:ABC-2 type transport system permease protein
MNMNSPVPQGSPTDPSRRARVPRLLENLGGYLRLFRAFFRIGLIGEAAYRVNFFLQLFQSLLELATALAGLAVIFSHTQTLGDWRPDEVLALVGVYFLVGGLIGLVIQPSMEELITSVREGTLDFTLTKPEDSQVLVSIRAVDIWRSIDVLMGTGVLVAALIRLGEHVGAVQAAAFGAMLFCGGAIIYSFWLILATLSFWFVRVENILEIFQSMYEAGRWPISLYPGWLRFALTFVVPVAFAVTVPAEALTARLDAATIAGTAILAVLLSAFSRAFWKIGMRQYSGASA